MKVFTYKKKTYQFSEDVTPPENGEYRAVLVDGNNVRCELSFNDGKIVKIEELD